MDWPRDGPASFAGALEDFKIFGEFETAAKLRERADSSLL
jgi:hypothetical protein